MADATLSACIGSIETIVMAAEMAQLTDLQEVCTALNEHLSSLHDSSVDYLQQHGQSLIEWSDAVLVYMRDPAGVAALKEQLLSPLPEAKRAGLLEEVAVSHAASCEDEPTEQPTDDSRFTETSPVAEVSNQEMEITQEEALPAEDAELIASETDDILDMAADGLTEVLEDNAEEQTASDLEAEVAVAVIETPEEDATPEEDIEPTATERVVALCADTLAAEIDENETNYFELPIAIGSDVVAEVATEFESESADPASTDPEWPAENIEVFSADANETESSEVETTVADSDSNEDDTILNHSDSDEDGVTIADSDSDEVETAVADSDSTADEPVMSEGEMAEIIRQLTEPLAELTPLVELLTAADTGEDELANAANAYSQILERVQTAGDVIGLAGLSGICELITHNVQALVEAPAEARAAAREVLEQWPLRVMDYLGDPSDDERRFGVVEQLLKPTWPLPLEQIYADELWLSLAPDAEEFLADVEARPTEATAEDVMLAIAEDVNPKLVDVFLQESPVNAADFSDCVARIGRGEEVLKNLAKAQRLAHNLKGSANLTGVKGVANLTHHVEDILEYLTIHQIVPPAPLAHLLQEAADCVETMLEALQGMAEAPPEAQQILQAVYDWANRMDAGQLQAGEEAAEEVAMAAPAPAPVAPVVPERASEPVSQPTVVSHNPAPKAEPAVTATETNKPAQQQAPVSAEKVLRVPTSTIDDLFRMVGEMSIALDQVQDRFRTIQRQSNELRTHDRIVQQRRFELENFVDVRHVATMQQRFKRVGDGREAFDPLELNEYDELYSSTRSFIETVTDSRRMTLQMRGELSSADRLLGQLQRMKQDLQHTVMQTRMEPVSTIGGRLQRSVRQACRATGKQAELVIEGADVLLDSEVLEKLADPLMHMLRNAVDHGVETPEKRIAAKKDAVGIIRLRFFQEGHNVVVQCIDDGSGLDYQRIREIAINKGLLDSHASPDSQALARLILMPGFTTRASATQISGRGVGLDVVYTVIQQLQGTMEISDAVTTGGCQISLRMPLTLMTSHCLVVEVAGQNYAIPTSAVARLLSPKTGQFNSIGAEIAYELGKEIYTARSLAACLHSGHTSGDEFSASKGVLLTHSDDGMVALTIDRVVDSYHLVVKGLGRYVKTVRGVSGLANLGDGSLVLVLDLPDLLRNRTTVKTGMAQSAALAMPTPARAVPQVLIVDDSLSVRQSLSELIKEGGFEPVLARDGVEAMDVLRKKLPSIVLSDIEMPRMNGLELVSYIRATHGHDLPVVMITSRTMQKHRQQAMEAGADLYVTKPFSEDDLLSSIENLLAANG
jgi:chemosensory pili system protein ChpA (sensor histidine kinase/response regulator)